MFQLDIRIFILSLSLGIPVFLVIANDDRRLLAWICFTCGLNIFDVLSFINFPAARIAGLLLIPQAFVNLGWMIRSKVARAVIVKYMSLVLSGIIFVLLLPWPDKGLDRLFNQLPEGRAIIYLIRSIADISLTFFVARQVIKRKCPISILNYFLVGTSLTALAGILEFVTGIDTFSLATGIESGADSFRVRGFCHEPRGLGLLVSIGLLFSITVFVYKRSYVGMSQIILHATTFIVAGSTSALVALGNGGFALGFFDKRVRSLLIKICLVCSLVIGFYSVYQLRFESNFYESIRSRLSGERFDLPSNLIESIAFRMEIFDGPALLFLADNPIYFFIGTGPGLIPIPATDYMPLTRYWKHMSSTGINSPPTIGLLLEISNSGVIGLLLWIIICIWSFQALTSLASHDPYKKEEWLVTRNAFVIGAAIYAVQTSPLSAIWPVLMGIGLGADYLVHTRKNLHQQNTYSL